MLNYTLRLSRMTSLVVAVFLLFSFRPAAASHEKQEAFSPVLNNELILQFPKVDDKSYAQVRSTLASVQGVTVDGYCVTNQVFVLIIDRTILPGDEPIFVALKNANCGEYYVKTGATAADVYASCSQIR
jgi:hypothetical protein